MDCVHQTGFSLFFSFKKNIPALSGTWSEHVIQIKLCLMLDSQCLLCIFQMPFFVCCSLEILGFSRCFNGLAVSYKRGNNRASLISLNSNFINCEVNKGQELRAIPSFRRI